MKKEWAHIYNPKTESFNTDIEKMITDIENLTKNLKQLTEKLNNIYGNKSFYRKVELKIKDKLYRKHYWEISGRIEFFELEYALEHKQYYLTLYFEPETSKYPVNVGGFELTDDEYNEGKSFNTFDEALIFIENKIKEIYEKFPGI